jgi:hypothetical protein
LTRFSNEGFHTNERWFRVLKRPISALVNLLNPLKIR